MTVRIIHYGITEKEVFMTVFDMLRRAMLAGVGAQEKVKGFVDELVKKGELSKSDGAKLVKEWTERADKSTADLGKSASELVEKTLAKMNLPTKTEIERLDKKLKTLSGRLKKMEEKTGVSEPEATE